MEGKVTGVVHLGGELIDRIMDYASSKSKFADARYMEIDTRGVSYKNGEFTGIQKTSEGGYAIRVMNDSISIACTDSEDWGKIREIVDRAVARSQFPGKNRISEGKGIKDSWRVDQKKKIEDMSVEDRIDIVRNYDGLLESLGAKIRLNVVSDKKVRQKYVNSVGSEIEGEISRVFYFYMLGILENGEFEQSSEQYGSSSGYEYIDSLDLEEKMTEEVRDLTETLSAPHVSPGKFDVIIGPEISGIVAHESAGHPTEYDRIIGREGALAGESFLTGKEYPFRIGSGAVSVVDDPSFRGSFGYYEYDDEGVKSRKRYLYRKGLTDEFILNRESAAILGTEPNGGGRSSSWNMEPLARMSTTYIEPGEYGFEELFEDVKRGIYIKSYTEWNIDDIRLNEKYVGKEAYIIQDGDLTGRVRRPVIETNTINFYSSIDAVGNDLQFNAGMCGKGDPMQGVDVWMGGPHVRLRGMYIQ
jgi:TldD protein